MRKIAALAAVLMLVASTVRAEGGELYLELEPALSVNRLSYGRTGIEKTRSEWGVAPRLGLSVRYGLADDWQLGLGFVYGWDGEVALEGVSVAGQHGRLYVGYRQFALPLSVSYLWTRGYDWSALLSAYAGPAFASWDEIALVDPSIKDATGKYVRLALTEQSPSGLGWVAGLSIAADWRPFDWFGLRIGPFIEASRGGVDKTQVTLGLTVRPVFIFGVGPSF